ncbi:hypothetical protein BLAT2472_40642 [Burkholderia latens]
MRTYNRDRQHCRDGTWLLRGGDPRLFQTNLIGSSAIGRNTNACLRSKAWFLTDPARPCRWLNQTVHQ